MGKTIAQRSEELAKQNADLTASVAGLEAGKAELVAQIEALTAQLASSVKVNDDTAAALLASKMAAENVSAELAQIVAERDAMSAKVQELSGVLALNPQVKQSDGQPAISGGDSASVQPSNWTAACKEHGYEKARAMYPELFNAFIQAAKPKP